ncbi:hypothetical protein QE109_14100 [Fusibacter bizertensis]|uniref:Uncharacterized protein n=1 Tax=Fusibacter bizertensis TaxID=1488331 RepID=A0ABT6NFW0_9FIRM|nr:hypothetical protein [Fusibacter bizertensis]MDH8679286.1 hypothetical protein [Fusibacter bizertensis]
MVRDFIYYDEMRIASYGSQLLEGIVEKISVSNESDNRKDFTTIIQSGANAKISTEGLISPFISNIIDNALNGSAGLGIDLKKEYTKNSIDKSAIIENKIAEHHRFTLFRESLIENSLLISIDDINSHEWENRKAIKKFEPGDFVEMTCRVKIFDVTHLEGMAVSLESLMTMLQQFMLSKEVEENPDKMKEIIERADNDATSYGYEIYQKVLGSSIAPLDFVAMMDLMKNISKGGLASVPTQLSARPLKSPKTGLKFIAPIRNEFLIDTKEELIFKYGYEPNQDWKILAQICEIPKQEHKASNKISDIKVDGDVKLDAMIESITNMFMEMNSTLGMNSVVRYPNISINLIAVYR